MSEQVPGQLELVHDCGYPEDTFACKIRHIHMNTGVAKANGVAAPGKPQHVEITPNGRVIR